MWSVNRVLSEKWIIAHVLCIRFHSVGFGEIISFYWRHVISSMTSFNLVFIGIATTISLLQLHWSNPKGYGQIWGLCCQKQVSQAGISNYIAQFTAGCNYLFLPEIPASGDKVLICQYRIQQSTMKDGQSFRWYRCVEMNKTKPNNIDIPLGYVSTGRDNG